MRFFESDRWRRLAFDVLVAITVLVLGLLGQVEITGDETGLFRRDPDALHAVLVVLMGAPLALRRLYPLPVFGVVLAAWVVDRTLDYPETLASAGVVIVFYTIGAELSRRRSYLVGGGTSVFIVFWTVLGAVTLESVTGVSVVTTTISTVTPLLIGREMHERRRRTAELQARLDEAERERAESARRAVAEERARIARELHDVVAHQMTVMTIQAEGARRVANGADPRVVEALDTIRATGRSALTEMRRVVGLLRSDDGEAEIAPLPRLDDVDVLVDQVRAAGVPVELDVRGEVRPLADGAELSAFRVVQESLTNSVRHGGPDVAASVCLDYREDQLEVLVEDNGRGVVAPGGDEGHGLIGMRERVAVLGGDFEAGPRPGGGFRVRACIPLES